MTDTSVDRSARQAVREISDRATRNAAGRARSAYAAYQRRVPRLKATTRSAPGRVLFLVPDWNRAAGGIRTIYRHVDLLNDENISAAVLHSRPGFRCTWFANQTRVVDTRSTELGPNDLLVVPEIYGWLLPLLPSGIRHVIFNQNAHLTWANDPAAVSAHYRGQEDLLGVVTVSDHNASLLRYAFPTTPVHRVHLGVDPRAFHPGVLPTGRVLSYMPRRARSDSVQVLAMLKNRGVLAEWQVLPIDGASEHQTAQLLQQSRVFLSFSHQEGFGLPPAEAMACGCYVVGSHGFAGREFLRPEFSSPTEPGDVLAMAQEAERALARDLEDDTWCQSRGVLASAFVLAEYSPERERAEVAGFYAPLLTR